ncbi:hypothetical protein CEXT_719661 [Caerostris extrusa]|uniref:Uncharacterized protein n=1 Tax=Caerostris extrusa TaxID=172846 RepID=A0AAV4W0V7_CAEEX|nr:hypothetical protein CEXT_719661 [Caerostris extrusa]
MWTFGDFGVITKLKRRVSLMADCLTVGGVFRERGFDHQILEKGSRSSGMQLEDTLNDNYLEHRLGLGILNLKSLDKLFELKRLEAYWKFLCHDY